MSIDPFNGKPIVNKKITAGDKNALLKDRDFLARLYSVLNIPTGGSTSVAPSGSGGISIGDTIGNSPTANGLLYSDGGVVANDLITIQEDSFFAGAVTAKSLKSSYTNFPTVGWVDTTGFGASPAVGTLTNGVTASNYLMVDTSTLSAKAVLNYNPGTPANSYFTIALANGLGGGNPEFNVTTTSVDAYQPLAMHSQKITGLAAGTTSGDAVRYEQAVLQTLADVKGDLVVASASDTFTRLAAGTDGYFLKANSGTGTGLEWVSAPSATPGGSDTQVQFNDSSAFGGDAGLTFNKTSNVLTSTSGYRMSAGSGNSIGDVDGNGNMYFDGNSAHIYGYAYINLRDGTGQYANLSRGGAYWEGTAIDTNPFGGGNYDAKMVFSGGQVNTYDTKAFGNYFGGKVGAQANGDKLYGVVFRPQFNVGAYTGLTKIGTIFVTPDASSLGMVVKGTSSQSVDMLQIRNSSDTVLSSFGSGGNLGIGGAATSTSKLNIQSIPTSSAGLATGDVWSNGGVLTIV